MPPDIQGVIDRYKDAFVTSEFSERVMSKDYEVFRREALIGKTGFYERACQFSQRLLTVSPNAQERARLLVSIETSHLQITPEGAASFATLFAFALILLGLFLGGVTYALGQPAFFTSLLFVLGGALLIKPLTKLPHYFALRWRLDAGSQMVWCVLYVVMYLRHTSNLEHAIRFAGEHVGVPLSLDLKKVFWDVESGRFVTIKESLDHYLEGWREYSLEFVEAFNLIEGSLYEPVEQRRLDILDKSLQVMLDGSYERMLHYAHDIKNPITILHMLGIILPVLGLVIFPLLGSLMGGLIKWYHLAILYNLVLPLLVFFYGTHVLSKRPSGYGQGSSFSSALLAQKSLLFSSVLLSSFFILIGLTPLLMHWFAPGIDFAFLGSSFLDYKGVHGPYGFGALLLSLFIPLGFAFGVSSYYRRKTRDLIGIREETDVLEKEFSGALFQLGTRVGDGIPAEIAFSHVAEQMKDSRSGHFFTLVDTNIRQLGMSLKNALFDEQRGALRAFPSPILETSMKVLVESAKKGPQVISSSLTTISSYLNRIQQVNERLKDLLAEVISSMTSQVSFLTPVIAGIVVGVGSMVVTIINLLSQQFQSVGGLDEGGLTGGVAAIANILRIEDVIPGFHFQSVVGLYVVELAAILTLLSTTIERGFDPVTGQYRLAKYTLRSTLLYLVIALGGIIVFNFLAQTVSIASAT